MLPICYPSSPSPTTGLPEAVAYALSSVSGLTRWVDYIPVKLVGSPLGMNEQTTNLNGFVPMRLLGSAIGMNAWSDYIPVYVDNSATEAWVTSATGYIPYANSVLGATTPAVDTITPVLTASSVTTGVAPFGVVVDGVQTTCSNGSINPLHDLLYFFECSDTGMGNFTNGQLAGLPRNQLVGRPVASFTMVTAGPQTISMWVYDGTTVWGPVTQSFTVQDPDVVYSGAATTVVSTSGNFTGAPAGATQVTSSDYSAIMNNASYAGSNKRVLFRDGETFTTGAAASKSGGTVNLYIGSYGGSGGANITATANSFTITNGLANGGNPANNANGWRITNLNIDANGFTGVNGFSMGVITDATGDANIKNYSKGNCTIYRLNFTNCATSLAFGALNSVATQCTINGTSGGIATSGQIGAWIGGAIRCAIVDCNFDNNHGGEHTVRVQGGDYCAYISNTLKRPATGKYYAAQRGWQVVTQTNAVDAQYNNWSYNTFDGTPATIGTLWFQMAPQNDATNEPIRDCWVHNNHFKAAKFGPVGLMITARDLSITNNTVDYPAFGGELSSDVTTCIYLRAPNVLQTVVNSGIRVCNNSVYRAGIGGLSFIKSEALTGGRIGSVAPIVRGNLVYATASLNNGSNSGSAPTFETPSAELPVDAVTGENSTDYQIKNTNPLFTGATSSQSGFALQSGSPYKNYAAEYKVRIDALGKLRTGATFDAGAVNAPDKQVAAWTLIP